MQLKKISAPVDFAAISAKRDDKREQIYYLRRRQNGRWRMNEVQNYTNKSARKK
jgi:hypothetical protein